MTGKEALEEIKKFKIVREHESVPYEIIKPITEYFSEQVSIIEKDLEILEILLASFLKKSIGEGTQPNTTILLDSQSYDRIKELLGNDK